MANSPGSQASGRRGLGGGSQFGGGGNNTTRGGGGILKPNKPGEDAVATDEAQKNSSTAYNTNKNALDLNDSQMQQTKPIVKGITTVLGLLPGAIAPGMGPAMTLGMNMNKWSSAALRKQNETDPNSVHTDPTHPGSVYGRVDGMMDSTQADVPGYNGTNGPRGLGKTATATDQPVKKKAKPITTLLGNVAQPLGTAANPNSIA